MRRLRATHHAAEPRRARHAVPLRKAKGEGGARCPIHRDLTLPVMCGLRYTRRFWGRILGMKGSTKVIAELNKALREELTAINQYFLHAEMCENWGYEKLSGYIKKQSIREMKHAEALMERILFLDGMPSMQPLALSIGSNVKDMIHADLKLEIEAVAMYNESVRIATDEKDNGSRDLFVALLK